VKTGSVENDHHTETKETISKLTLVIIESPFSGDQQKNISYARACMSDSLKRGEAPYASHLLYTQDGILNDEIPEERAMGIEAGLAWGKLAEKTVIYTDLGISKGMQIGIERALQEGRTVEFRSLPNYNAIP
jgi:hypothetical protein